MTDIQGLMVLLGLTVMVLFVIVGIWWIMEWRN